LIVDMGVTPVLTRSSADADNALDANEAVIRVIRGSQIFENRSRDPGHAHL